jgi:hypothetical protein
MSYLTRFVLLLVLLSPLPARALELLDVQSTLQGYNPRGHNLTADEQSLYRDLQRGVGQAAPEARTYGYASSGVNILVLGDGYRQEDIQRYQALANRAAQALFNNEVVAEAQAAYKLRLYPYFVASRDAGASSYTKNAYRSTALGATYYDRHGGDTTIWVNFQTAWAVARQISNSFQYILVLVNAGQYAAMYWDYGICIVADFDRLTGVTNPVTFEDIVCHELLGHTVSGLWDEYVYNGKPNVHVNQSPNCDASNQYPKWYNLVGWQSYNWNWTYVGAYQGCAMGSYFRPTDTDCKMNTWAQKPFCPVCKNQIRYALSRY